MGIKIVLLARNCDSSSIVFNYLQKHIEFDAVLIEKPLSQSRHLSKRIKRLGFWLAMGQAAFMLLIYPILKIISKKRKQEIIEKYNLDLRCIPNISFLSVAIAQYPPCTPLNNGVMPTWIFINEAETHSRVFFEIIPVPLIMIRSGSSSFKIFRLVSLFRLITS